MPTTYDTKKLLNLITWTLNININIIGVKRVRDFLKCNHNTSQCVFLYYMYQNSIIKLFYPCSNYHSVTLLYHKKTYYVLANHNVTPLLINLTPSQIIQYKNQNVTLQDIQHVLNNEPVHFTFSIAVYTAFSYVNQTFVKQIQKTIIGNSQGISEPHQRLHVFLTPELNSGKFYISKLDKMSISNDDFHKKNLFVNPHITEGYQSYHATDIPKQDMLNETFCVCDHTNTNRIFLPHPRSFKPLGKLIYFNIHHDIPSNDYIPMVYSASSANQKNFLVENLGKFSLSYGSQLKT